MISFLQCIIFEPISYSEFILAKATKHLALVFFIFYISSELET